MPRFRKKVKKKIVPEEPKSIFTPLLVFIKERRRFFIIASALVFMAPLIIAGVVGANIYFNKKAEALMYDASVEYYQNTKYNKALELYNQVVTKYPRTKSAPLAQFGIGNSYYKIGDFNNAIKSYRFFIDRYHKITWLLPLVYHKMGYAYLQAGDTSKAIESFELASRSEECGIGDLCYFEIAKIYESIGKEEDAIKNYQVIVEKFPFSPWVTEASESIKRLKKG